MRHAQQCEVCFNLFCVRIEVRMSILQYYKRFSSLSRNSLPIVCLHIHDNHRSQTLQCTSPSSNQHATSMWHKENTEFVAHRCLVFPRLASFYCLSMIGDASQHSPIFFTNPLQQPFHQTFLAPPKFFTVRYIIMYIHTCTYMQLVITKQY